MTAGQLPFSPAAGFVQAVPHCEGCGGARPPGRQPCPSCGRERHGYGGTPYPAQQMERFLWVFDQAITDRNAFATLLALVWFDGPNGRGVFPTVKRLAETARLSTRVTRDAVRWLENHGWIVCVQRRRGGRQTSNRYSIRQAEQAAVSAGSQAAVSADKMKGGRFERGKKEGYEQRTRC